MPQPWETLDSRDTSDGLLELRRRAETDFLMCLDGRVLMNSRESRSEEALGIDTARAVHSVSKPCVLVGGLGMGLTLRSALADLPPAARVTVAELQPCVVDWCKVELRELCGNALADPRVTVQIGDVWDLLGEAQAGGQRFDAIALDLYEGAGRVPETPRVFQGEGLDRIRAALLPGGGLLRWTERRDPDFERQLPRVGFETTSRRVGRGGRRHILYHARLRGS